MDGSRSHRHGQVYDGRRRIFVWLCLPRGECACGLSSSQCLRQDATASDLPPPQIVSGACPFPDLKNEKQVIHQIGRGRRPEWPLPHEGDAQIISALGDLARACWADDPATRPSMRSLVEAQGYNQPSFAGLQNPDEEASSRLWQLLLRWHHPESS